ncbi:glucokinase [Nocardia tengchongensis]|uniref:glucokinase n=1 Tax=Nocardia tengchongensis TaxID=2055889 RepID=UPI003657AE1C
MSLPLTAEPFLVADIGGTHARFGLVSGRCPDPHDVRILRCADYPDLVSAIEDYLHRIEGPRPVAACVAVAGPVLGDRVRLTNSGWDFGVMEARRRLRLRRLEVINDFTALALAVPHLPREAFVGIGAGIRRHGEPIAVIGPGTGLGVAALVRSGETWVPVPGEGGHAGLPVETAREAEIAAVLRQRHEVVCAETVLSGPGLVRLYQAVALLRGVPAPCTHPEQIHRAARRFDDPIAHETLEVFFGMFGAFCANVALTFGARGGVLLGGGVLPDMSDLLSSSDFRRRFVGNRSVPGYLDDVATEIITAHVPALRGAACLLAQHDPALETA